MIHLYYNEKSIINKYPVIRKINNLFLFLVLMTSLSTNEPFFHCGKFIHIVIFAVITSFSSCVMIENVVKHTHFFEWDFTERKKKTTFIICYGMINYIFCCIFYYVLIYSILNYRNHIIIIIASIIEIITLFNIVNLISLHYWWFEDLLEIGNIQEKPKGWVENGKEYTDEDMFNDIMRRDFNC